jgi:glycosyltransferase involved in cell wall biosynthesis
MTLHVRYKPKEARGMAGLVCVADWQKTDVERFPGPVVVAHNWPPAPRPVSETEIQTLRRRLNAGPGVVVVGFVGRLEPVKGVDRLIRAYRAWATPRTRLAIVGDGRERAHLNALAAGDPTIHFLGHVSPADACYQAIDLLVMPSDWEGLPLVALEAMHMGTPILASACAGTSEALAGSPAMLIPSGQGPLTEALGALMAKGERGELLRLEYDLSRFCPDRSAARIEAFYRDIIQTKTAPAASETSWLFRRAGL